MIKAWFYNNYNIRSTRATCIYDQFDGPEENW